MAKKLKPKLHSASETPVSSRLQVMRQNLGVDEAGILNFLWDYYRKHANWPMTRFVNSRYGGKQKAREILEKIGGDIVRETSNYPLRYELTLIGILLTADGEKHFQLILKYVEFLRQQYFKNPEVLHFSDQEVVEGVKLSEEDKKLLPVLLDVGNLSGGGARGPSWSIAVPDFIEDLDEPLNRSLEDYLFRSFKRSRIVFDKGYRGAPVQKVSVFSSEDIAHEPSNFGPHFPQVPLGVDALKRRYQVFVSSTYEDLKEERQSIILALLESKCIPTGMELFPAASLEQWQVIQKIIQECDYYIVIVAGRYGSLNEAGISFTEMEFDYACELGKPVIGFYHRNPQSLPGSRIEETDKGKERLRAFTEKVKERLCRSWSSPAELGSAVKSAIFSELELTPQPGWIRADAVPSSEAIEKMKQRIADLEEQLKKQRKATARANSEKPALPEGNQVVDMPVTVSYDFRKVKIDLPGFDDQYETQPQKELEEAVSLSWDELILICAGDLQSGSQLREIQKTFDSKIAEKVQRLVEKRLGSAKTRYDFESSQPKLELALKTLMAKKLVKMSSVWGGWSNPNWQFTPRGLQYLAELQAIRSGVSI